MVGAGRGCTVVFDRGGYSPAVFAEILAAGFDLLTYYKGGWARAPQTAFTVHDYTAPDGGTARYELAERRLELPVPARGGAPASTVTLRLVVRRSPDGHQTPILTNRTDVPAAEVAYRMSARWRQENYFKYARDHFALDALDSYADHDDDGDRLVPNPAKADAARCVTDARADLAVAHAQMSAPIEEATTRGRQPGNGATATVDSSAARALTAAETALATARAASRQTVSHLPLAQVRPGSRRLETERKLLTHAIRMSAYRLAPAATVAGTRQSACGSWAESLEQ